MKDDELKGVLTEAFGTALFGAGRERERVLRRSRALQWASGAQRKREQDLVREMKEHERVDAARRQAEIAVANGNEGDIDLSVLGPTPEQLAKAEYVPVQGIRDERLKGRTVMTVRRRDVPVAHRMLMKGIIDTAGYAACVWYRNAWEASGMMGNIPSTDYTKEVFAGPTSRSQLTDSQMEIADCLRFIVSKMNARHGRLIYATVVQDTPIQRAVRAARAFHRHPNEGFREAVAQLVDAKKDYEKA
jgi:hypothetical protein